MGKEYKAPEQTIDDISLLDPKATYSYADYLRWSFEERVELIKGKIFRMTAAPATKHQRVSFRLSGIFSFLLKGQKCEGFTAPFDVRLPKNVNDPDSKIYTVIQPDICVVCDPKKIDEAGCKGTPDLIVEILSPSTSKKDLEHKYELYEEHEVKEYWVVYPGEEIVEVFLLGTDGKYQRGKKYTGEDEIKSSTITGLAVKLTDVFY